MILTIRDETASGSVTNKLTLDVLTENLTVRELIRGRVYQEVQDYNQRQRRQADFVFRGLVTPTGAEPAAGGPAGGARLKRPREIDWKEQFDRACEAFERNGFFLLIHDRQAESLDERITLRHDTRVSFVKLVPLVGG
jgi:hypothetical protein